jgi:hypothetical protein
MQCAVLQASRAIRGPPEQRDIGAGEHGRLNSMLRNRGKRDFHTARNLKIAICRGEPTLEQAKVNSHILARTSKERDGTQWDVREKNLYGAGCHVDPAIGKRYDRIHPIINIHRHTI